MRHALFALQRFQRGAKKMSETQSETSLDFQPLIDIDTEDFEIAPLPAGVPVRQSARKRRLWLIPIVVALPCNIPRRRPPSAIWPLPYPRRGLCRRTRSTT